MLLSLVLFAMGAQSWALSTQCDRSTSMKFSVSSWRNESGHRLVGADVQSGSSDKDSVSLAVELLSEKCGDSRSVILKTLSSTGQPEERTSVSSTEAPTCSISIGIRRCYRSGLYLQEPAVLPLPGYHHLPGFGYYKKLPNYMNWNDGVEACRKEGTHMLLVDSQEEIDAVYGWCGCYPWIGVHRESSSGPWINVLGRQMNSTDFFGWASGYPTGQHNCMRMWSREGTYNPACQDSYPVVCEQIL